MSIRSKIALALFFGINIFLQLYKVGSSELGGDESASYVAILPFLSFLFQGKILPSFLTYFHEPLQLVLQAPLVLFGINEIIARLPNIFSGILILFVVFKIVQEHFFEASKRFNQQMLFIPLFLFSISSYFILTRQAINIGVFALIMSLFVYYFLNFTRSNSSTSFKLMLSFLFLSIFVYIDSIFLIPGLILYLFWKKNSLPLSLKRQVLIFLFAVTAVFFVWGVTVFFGSITSHIYSWQQSAPFRLFFRGGSGLGHLSLAANYAVLTRYTSNIATVFIIFFLIISFFNHKAKPLWCIFFLPLIYFNLIKTPTVHLLHFFIFIILLSSLGWQFMWRKSNPTIRTLMISALSISMVANLYQIADNLRKIHPHHYREIALYVEKMTAECEFILTDVDGYAARLYFRRRYVNFPDSKVSLAVVSSTKTPLYRKLASSGYSLAAVTPSFTSPELLVLQKNHVGGIIELHEIDSSLTDFDNLLPYQNCQRWKLPSLWTIHQR